MCNVQLVLAVLLACCAAVSSQAQHDMISFEWVAAPCHARVPAYLQEKLRAVISVDLARLEMDCKLAVLNVPPTLSIHAYTLKGSTLAWQSPHQKQRWQWRICFTSPACRRRLGPSNR